MISLRPGFLFLIVSTIHVCAQDIKKEISASDSHHSKFYISARYQILRSTHATYFSGGDLLVSRPVSPRLDIGFGAEYVYCHFHNDNEWKLFNVSCLPVFINAKLKLSSSEKFTHFLELSQGISFNNYRKEDLYEIFSPYHVSETGYYVYAGAGASIRISPRLVWLVGIGFKGYRMSLNALDVNPHGLNFSGGLRLSL